MDNRFGKFVNNSPKRFAKLIKKKINVNQTPHLCCLQHKTFKLRRNSGLFDKSTFFSFFIVSAPLYDVQNSCET